MPADETVNSGPTAPGRGDPARRAVGAAIAAAGMTLKQASKALGRNDAYLQQYLYRGTPRRLPEPLRLRLAEITGADQADFLDPALRALRPPSNGGMMVRCGCRFMLSAPPPVVAALPTRRPAAATPSPFRRPFCAGSRRRRPAG